MTDNLFLIAHKVSGAPAFDVATQMPCPECNKIIDGKAIEDARRLVCNECDNLGYWWVIPTSGHRAYPYWSVALCDVDDQYELNLDYWRDLGDGADYWPGPMPPDLPDHYTTSATPKFDLTEALGIKRKPAPSAPIDRRF